MPSTPIVEVTVLQNPYPVVTKVKRPNQPGPTTVAVTDNARY